MRKEIWISLSILLVAFVASAFLIFTWFQKELSYQEPLPSPTLISGEYNENVTENIYVEDNFVVMNAGFVGTFCYGLGVSVAHLNNNITFSVIPSSPDLGPVPHGCTMVIGTETVNAKYGPLRAGRYSVKIDTGLSYCPPDTDYDLCFDSPPIEPRIITIS